MFVVFICFDIFDNLRQFGVYLSNDLHIWIHLAARGKAFKNPIIWQEPHIKDFTSLVAAATAINLNCKEEVFFNKSIVQQVNGFLRLMGVFLFIIQKQTR